MSSEELYGRVLALAVAGATSRDVQRAARQAAGNGEDPAPAAVVDRLEHRFHAPRQRVEATREALSAAGARMLVAGCPGYPSRLLDAWPWHGAPLWLFLQGGGHGLPAAAAVAVVGTRHPSLDGLDTARALGGALARAGATVVSGLARGVDQAAHRAALDAGGATCAVLGTGLGVDYPHGDEEIRRQVAQSGGLVTELLPGTPPRGHQFLARNRIISGLSDVVVVVEGRGRSGALSTAQHAADQGREVMACPGSINAPASRAPLALLRDGATLVTCVDDVVAAAGALAMRVEEPAPRSSQAHDDDSVLGSVLRLLGARPASPDDLAVAAGLAPQEVLGALAELTVQGRAVHAGGGFVRRPGP